MFSLVLSFAPKERTGWGLGIPQGVVLVVDVWMDVVGCGCDDVIQSIGPRPYALLLAPYRVT